MNDIVRDVAEAADSELARETRSRDVAEIVRRGRGYRWIVIYDVGDEGAVPIGGAGEGPAEGYAGPNAGAAADALRTRATVRSRDQLRAAVPVLGAESGIVIGLLEAASERALTDADVDFLEACAAALRALYD
jgi:hypothetical protein